MQTSPVVDQCNLACTYCWREPHMDTLELTDQDPLELLYESVRASSVDCYLGLVASKSSKRKMVRCSEPKTRCYFPQWRANLYRRLGEYIDLCHKHGMTTMLVTNGTFPKVLERLDPLPTQLYVSVDAPNKEIFDKVCKPNGMLVHGSNLKDQLTYYHL